MFVHCVLRLSRILAALSIALAISWTTAAAQYPSDQSSTTLPEDKQCDFISLLDEKAHKYTGPRIGEDAKFLAIHNALVEYKCVGDLTITSNGNTYNEIDLHHLRMVNNLQPVGPSRWRCISFTDDTKRVWVMSERGPVLPVNIDVLRPLWDRSDLTPVELRRAMREADKGWEIVNQCEADSLDVFDSYSYATTPYSSLDKIFDGYFPSDVQKAEYTILFLKQKNDYLSEGASSETTSADRLKLAGLLEGKLNLLTRAAFLCADDLYVATWTRASLSFQRRVIDEKMEAELNELNEINGKSAHRCITAGLLK